MMKMNKLNSERLRLQLIFRKNDFRIFRFSEFNSELPIRVHDGFFSSTDDSQYFLPYKRTEKEYYHMNI